MHQTIIYRRCSLGLKSGHWEDHNIQFTSFSLSSNHSVTSAFCFSIMWEKWHYATLLQPYRGIYDNTYIMLFHSKSCHAQLQPMNPPPAFLSPSFTPPPISHIGCEAPIQYTSTGLQCGGFSSGAPGSVLFLFKPIQNHPHFLLRWLGPQTELADCSESCCDRWH